MTILYSCRHSGDQYRITKFDEHMNVESSYLCTTTECDCPAGHRRMCRHREMLPRFIQRGHVNSSWMFDYDRGGWVQMFEDTPALTSEGVPLPEIEHTTPADTETGLVKDWRYLARVANVETTELASEASTTPAEPDPYTVTPEMIADASEYIDRNTSLAAPPPAKSWRRF